MKRLFRFGITGLLVLFSLPVYSATINMSPTTVSIVKGQNITVTIQVDPLTSKLYTVKSSLTFNPLLLEAVSFTQSSGWMVLSTTGYDLMDNVNGLVIKTAGFPGGVTSLKTFGTLVFRAKESGVATISVDSNSFAYDAQNKNLLSGTQGVATITVTSPATPPPSQEDKTTVNTNTNTNQNIPQNNTQNTTQTNQQVTATSSDEVGQDTDTSQVAAVAEAGGLNSKYWTVLVIALLALLLGGGYVFWINRRGV